MRERYALITAFYTAAGSGAKSAQANGLHIKDVDLIP